MNPTTQSHGKEEDDNLHTSDTSSDETIPFAESDEDLCSDKEHEGKHLKILMKHPQPVNNKSVVPLELTVYLNT